MIGGGAFEPEAILKRSMLQLIDKTILSPQRKIKALLIAKDKRKHAYCTITDNLMVMNLAVPVCLQEFHSFPEEP